MTEMNSPESNNSLTHDSRGSTWTPVAIIVLLLIVGGIIFLLNDSHSQNGKEVQNATSSNDVPMSWRVYEDKRLGFRIRYPDEGWTMTKAPNHPIGPRFSIHKNDSIEEPVEEPLNHFATGTYVGIYPQGIPTEGVTGQSTSTNPFELGVESTSTRTYLLADNTPWASYIKFTDRPGTWSKHGFLWARAAIDKLQTTCMRGGKEIPANECDPMFGDTIVRSGNLSQDDWNTVKKIVESFSFIPLATSTSAVQQ